MSDLIWDAEVSEDTRAILGYLGSFGPTLNEEHCELKGHIDGDKEYWDSDFLREAAVAFVEAADWLDKRAGKTK